LGKEKVNIVFLSSQVRYLSNQVYKELINELRNFSCRLVYFESDFNENNKYFNNDFNTELKLKELFDEVVYIPTFQKLIKDKRTKISRFLAHYEWKNIFLSQLNALQPDLILSISSAEVNFVMTDSCTILNLVYVQPSVILEKVPMKWEKKIKFLMFRHLFKLPIFRKNIYTPFESKRAEYIIWTPIWVNQVVARLHKVHYCGYPTANLKNYPIQGKTRIEKVIIYLNKKSYIGMDRWVLYAELYKKLIKLDTKRQYLLKIHPLDNYEETISFFSGFDIRVEPISYTQFDAIISHWSTAIMEPMTMDFPVVLVNPDNKFDFSNIHLENYPFIAIDSTSVISFLDNFEKSHLPIEAQAKFKSQLLGDSNNTSINTMAKIIMDISHR
jgi:hypothetical protein